MLRNNDQADINPSTSKARGKYFYGWITAAAGALVVFAAGNFLYTFGVFVKPLIDQFGWSRAAISLCVSIRNVTTAIMSPVIGIFADRLGPKIFVLFGVVLVGICYLFAARIDTLWQLYLLLGVGTGLGIAALFVPSIAMVIRWFGGKSALANGVLLSGFGWAQIILPPVETYLILQYGWETCFIILGVAALALGIFAWAFMRIPPGSLVASQVPGQEDALNFRKAPDITRQEFTLSRALRTRTLWTMFLTLVIGAATFQMIVVHIIAAAIDAGAAPEAAAVIITLNGVTNTLGRLTFGGFANKFGNKIVLTICLAIQALTLFALSGTSNLYPLYVIASVHGLAYGGMTPIITSMAGGYFGTGAISSIFGSLNTAYTSGAAVGPFIGGYVFDVTGSYFAAFLSSAVAMTAAFLLSLLLRPPRATSDTEQAG